MPDENPYLRILTLACDGATALASEELDRPLSRPERLALRIHLILCRSCRRFRRQVGLIREAMSRLADDPGALPLDACPPLPPDARARLQDAIDRARLES